MENVKETRTRLICICEFNLNLASPCGDVSRSFFFSTGRSLDWEGVGGERGECV